MAREHDLIEVVVEIPRGSRNKYEFDKTRGIREIENFFQTYKALEDKWTDVVGWEDAVAAARAIDAARDLYSRGLESSELP
jgi:inorganic pyrophosphatase